MSEIIPTHVPPSDPQLGPFAFCSMNGRQAGHVLLLDSTKTVLEFDAADDKTKSQPTRCLVIQGLNGVNVQTIQGVMTVNDRIQQDAWLSLNDEISLGHARLRLIRQRDWDAALREPADRSRGTFFSPFNSPDPPGELPADHATLCPSPCELRELFEPTGFGAEWSQQIVGWHIRFECDDHSPCDAMPQADVHGVIVH